MGQSGTSSHDRRATVASGFVTGIVSGLSRMGLSPEATLHRAGIATSLLDNPESRVPLARYAALYRLINERLDDEAFGLFSRPLPRGTFEFLCRGALSATTLAEALDRIARFLCLVQNHFKIEVQRDNGSALLILAEDLPLPVLDAGRVFAHEWLLRMIHGLAAWLVARPLAFGEVAFPYAPPPHVAEYELLFAPRCSFGAPRLVARFPAENLTFPVRRDEAALRQFLVEAPASITTLYRRDRAMALRVRDVLRAALPAQVSLPDVARTLFVSPRTLHRRLEDEGLSFRAVREALRRDLAVEWLTKTDRPLSDIAAELGFADASAFYRSFAAWAGSGPREYRRRFKQP